MVAITRTPPTQEQKQMLPELQYQGREQKQMPPPPELQYQEGFAAYPARTVEPCSRKRED